MIVVVSEEFKRELVEAILNDRFEIKEVIHVVPGEKIAMVKCDLKKKPFEDSMDAMMYAMHAAKFAPPPKEKQTSLAVERIIFNYPATIVIWKDGTKTVVKCGPSDMFDPEKGVALCFMKKALGNKSNYNNVFREWIGIDWIGVESYDAHVEVTVAMEELSMDDRVALEDAKCDICKYGPSRRLLVSCLGCCYPHFKSWHASAEVRGGERGE